MSAFRGLPSEINTGILVQLSYEEIKDTCLTQDLNLCDDVNFWWEKVKYELENNAINLEILLREATELRQYEYLKATLANYHDNDTRVFKVLFNYGFIIDNIEILRKYAQTQQHDLIQQYSLINSYDDEIYEDTLHGEITKHTTYNWKYTESENIYLNTAYGKIQQIIKHGYYTLNELYKLISLSLENNKLNVLKLIIAINLPLPSHPRRNIFDKLILRYIGLSRNPEYHAQDTLKFGLLVSLYVKIIINEHSLYNLIYNNYNIESIDSKMYRIIYSPLTEVFAQSTLVAIRHDKKQPDVIWLLDLVNKFQIKHVQYCLNRYQWKGRSKFLQLIYDNGKIMNHLITQYITRTPYEESKFIIRFLANANLSINQFKACMKNMNNEQLEYFVENFLLPDNLIAKIDDITQKTKLILEDKRFPVNKIKGIMGFYMGSIMEVTYDKYKPIFMLIRNKHVKNFLNSNNISVQIINNTLKFKRS